MLDNLESRGGLIVDRHCPEIAAELQSLEDLHSLMAENPWLFERKWIQNSAEAAVNAGAVEPLSGLPILSGQLQGVDNLREGLVYKGVNSRVRAVMLCIQELIPPNPKIYAAEAVTALALRLRGMFPKFIGSEYAGSEEQKRDLFPIASEDLQNLSFPSGVFDIITTNEVLEHIPSIDAALSEMCRVLKPGGWHVGTVPFAYGDHESTVKTKLIGDKIVHLMEPEYHGNPVDEQGSLVFEIPGWNILDRARSAGFRNAHVRYILSTRHACFSSDAGGIFVLCFQK